MREGNQIKPGALGLVEGLFFVGDCFYRGAWGVHYVSGQRTGAAGGSAESGPF